MSRPDFLRWALAAVTAALLMLFACLLLVGFARFAQPEARLQWWRPAGGPFDRQVFSLALDRTASGHLWAAMTGAGLQEWQPEAGAWNPVTPTNAQTETILPDPSLARVVVATDETPPTIYVGAKTTGIFRVRNHGQDWTHLYPELALADERDLEDPVNMAARFEELELAINHLGNVEALALGDAQGSTLFAATPGGVYVTTDGSAAWQRLPYPATELEDSNTISLLSAADGHLYAGTQRGVWRLALPVTNTRQAAWEVVGPSPESVQSEIVAMVQLPDRSLLIGTIGQGVWATSNGGATWEERNQGIPEDPIARRAQALLVSTSGDIFVGTTDYGVYRSRDGARTWQPSGAGLTGPATSVLTLVEDNFTHTLFAGTYGGGVYRSTDSGDSWQPLNDGLPVGTSPAISRIVWAGPQKDTVFVGTESAGLYSGTLAAQSWSRVPKALPLTAGGTGVREVNDMVSDARGDWLTIAAGTGVFLTSDGGTTWQERSTGLPERENVERLAQADNPLHMYAAVIPKLTDSTQPPQLFQTTNGGESWTPLPCPPGTGAGCPSLGLATSRDGHEVFAAIQLQGVARSTDDGRRWGEPNPASPVDAQQLIHVSSRAQTWLGGFYPARSTLHAYSPTGSFSSDDIEQPEVEETWQFGVSQVLALAVDANRPTVVYAASDQTYTDTLSLDTPLQVPTPASIEQAPQKTGYILWMSDNNGEQWRAVALSDVPIRALAADPDRAGHLVGGTENRGVFEVAIPLPSPLGDAGVMVRLYLVPGLPLLAAGIVLAFIFGTYQILARPYQFPLTRALHLRIRHGRALERVRGSMERLASLEQLILLAAPADAFDSDTAWRQLTNLGAVASQGSLITSLENLVRAGLLEKTGETYRLVEPEFHTLAAVNFGPRQSELVREVRSSSRLFRLAETYFIHAGFDVVPLLHQFVLVAGTGAYLLAGRLEAWLYLDRPLDANDVAELAVQLRDQQQTLGFVVASMRPTLEAYAALRALRKTEGLRLTIVSTSTINQALRHRSVTSSLDLAVRIAGSDLNLYDLVGPVSDHLALFGRHDVVHDVSSRLNSGDSLRLWALPTVGKTSLLWNLREQLGPATYGALGSLTAATHEAALYSALLADLSADIQMSYTALARPLPSLVVRGLMPDLPSEAPLPAFEEHLKQLVVQLRQVGYEPRIVLLIDVVGYMTPSSQVISRTLQDLARRTPWLSVILADSEVPAPVGKTAVAFPADLPISSIHLSPLTEEASSELLTAIGAQVGLSYAADALHQAYLETGGHPLWLRMLGKRLANPNDPAVKYVDRNEVLAEVERIVADRFVLAELLWDALDPHAQRVLLALASGTNPDQSPVPLDETVRDKDRLLDDMTAFGLLHTSTAPAGYEHRIGMLRRWLIAEFL